MPTTRPPSSRHHHSTLLLAHILLVWATLTKAQTPTTSTSTSPSTTTPAYASIVPSSTSYTYIGCYNETTGNDAAGNVRALAGGSVNASDSMTVEYCFQLCGSATYAGLEYGRECWCAPYLNAESVKLADVNCALRCSGDETEVCGGDLMLTLYQRRAGGTTKKNAAAGGRGWEGVVGGAAVVVVAVVVGMLGL